jgi:hypothetical protein
MLIVPSDNYGLEFSLYVDPLQVYLLTGGQQEFHYKCFLIGMPSLGCIGIYSDQEQFNTKKQA